VIRKLPQLKNKVFSFSGTPPHFQPISLPKWAEIWSSEAGFSHCHPSPLCSIFIENRLPDRFFFEQAQEAGCKIYKDEQPPNTLGFLNQTLPKFHIDVHYDTVMLNGGSFA
jgi:hypothetical protein